MTMPSDNPAQEQPRRWNGRDLIEVLRGAIDKMKSEGRTDVPIAGLESFLSTAQEKLQNDSVSVPPEVIEHAKMVHASNLAAYEASTASSRELFKSVIDMAKLTVTSLTLINGGVQWHCLLSLVNSPLLSSRVSQSHRLRRRCSFLVSE